MTIPVTAAADNRVTAATGTLFPPGAPHTVRLGTTLQFSGGVAILWFHERVAEWNRMISAYRREQRRGAGGGAVVPASQRVH